MPDFVESRPRIINPHRRPCLERGVPESVAHAAEHTFQHFPCQAVFKEGEDPADGGDHFFEGDVELLC